MMKPMNKGRILIVEDMMLVARDLEHTLQSVGYEVVGIAVSGTQAVAMTARTKPDVILMDIQLKGEKDGIHAAEVIGRRFETPVIYLTAHSDKYTVERARITRPAAYIVKPYNPERLEETIQKALQYGRGAIGQVARDEARDASVLLVDNSDYTQTVMLNLMGRNHRVKLSPSIGHAKDMIRQALSPFDLIVMNIDLPDAREGVAVRELRRDMQVTTPIVAMGRRMSTETASFLKTENVCGFVEKRPDFEYRLLEEVDKALA